MDTRLLKETSLTYQFKGFGQKTVTIPALGDFDINAPDAVDNLLRFSKYIQYSKWIRDDSSRSSITLEQFTAAHSGGPKSINGLDIPQLKTLTIVNSGNPDTLQL